MNIHDREARVNLMMATRELLHDGDLRTALQYAEAADSIIEKGQFETPNDMRLSDEYREMIDAVNNMGWNPDEISYKGTYYWNLSGSDVDVTEEVLGALPVADNDRSEGLLHKVKVETIRARGGDEDAGMLRRRIERKGNGDQAVEVVVGDWEFVSADRIFWER